MGRPKKIEQIAEDGGIGRVGRRAMNSRSRKKLAQFPFGGGIGRLEGVLMRKEVGMQGQSCGRVPDNVRDALRIVSAALRRKLGR